MTWGIILICLFVLLYAIELTLTYSTGKYTKWVRKLFWWYIRRSYIRVMKGGNPLLVYPMTVYITLDPEPKKVFIEQGFKACKEVMLKHLDEVFDIYTNPEKVYKEKVDKVRQELKDFREKYRESKLSYDEIQFIKEYEETMKNSKA